MLKPVLDIGVPALVILTMVAVGLGLTVAVTLLTGLAFAAGWATVWTGGNRTDRFTGGLVFGVRNVGVATAVAVTVLRRLEFTVFASACFLSQTPFLLTAAFLHRHMRTAAPGLNLAE